MFGSIGFPELVLVFIVVLLVFGPKKLPEFARLLGKALHEFRSTVNEAKSAIEDEIYKEGMAGHLKDIGQDVKDALNITGEIGKDMKNALDIYGDIDKPAAKDAEKKDEKKSE